MGHWMWWQCSTILNCYQKAVAPFTIPVTKASDVVIGEVWSDIKKILLIFFWVYTAFRTIYLKFQTFFYWLVVLILRNTLIVSCQYSAQVPSRTNEWCIQAKLPLSQELHLDYTTLIAWSVTKGCVYLRTGLECDIAKSSYQDGVWKIITCLSFGFLSGTT